MHAIHFSNWVTDWFDSMPEPYRALAYKLFYGFGILSVVFLVWRLSSSEQRLESGKLETKWYHPRDWYQRFLAIKEENYKQYPELAIAFIKGSEKLFTKVYGICGFLIGVLLLGIYVWLGFEPGWFGLLGVAMIVFAYFLLKKPSKL